MRFRRFSFATLLVITACASAASPEATISALEDQYNQSRLAGDAKTLAALLDDSWTMVHVDGRVESKSSYVDGIATAARQIQSIDVHERQIRVFGSVAVVTGDVSQRGVRRGETRVGRLRFTHVWVRQSNGWRMIVTQSTEIKE